MKLRHVFALVPDCHVPGWRYAEVWRRHFYRGLIQAGLKVSVPQKVDFSWARPPQTTDASRSATARVRVSQALASQILREEGERPDAVLSYCFSNDLELELVDQVRAAGIPWVNFFCDSLYAFNWVAHLAARTSLNWFVESAAEKRYGELGVPWVRAPYALNPAELPDASCAAPDQALLFVGAVNRFRIQAASLVRLAGADLQLRGWGWSEAFQPAPAQTPGSANLLKRAAWTGVRRLLGTRVGGHLDFDSMIAELRRSAVILGLNEGGIGRSAGSYLKLRELEFPGMGCCYLAQDHPDLADIYSLGSEVVTFRNPWEAGRIAKDLARHPAECRAIGRRARARVLREHTWSARLPLIESHL